MNTASSRRSRQLRLQADTMARAGLLLFLLAVTCEYCTVESFSLAPGGFQGVPSREVWQNAKPSSTLARNSFARSHVTHDGCAGRTGAAERGSSGRLSTATAAVTESSEYLENKEELKKDLEVEYTSFFDNFASERYLPNVEFIDPLTSFTGFQKYKNNVDMLGGRSALGNILFKDANIVLHSIEEPGPFRLRTRWTLTVCFKALPWQPAPCFTGISDYTIDDQARVVRQVDFWDSINLVEGRYQAVNVLVGLKDFVGQVLPGPEAAAPGGAGGAAGQLLRRANEYEVRRMEGGVVVATREFDEEATEAAVAVNRRMLLDRVSVDGLTAKGEPELLSTPGARKQNQLSVPLTEHEWMI